MRRRQAYAIKFPSTSMKGDTVVRIDTPQDEAMGEAKVKKLTAKKRGRPKKQEV